MSNLVDSVAVKCYTVFKRDSYLHNPSYIKQEQAFKSVYHQNYSGGVIFRYNLLLFGFYSTPFLLGLGAVVAGFCYGGLLSVFPALVADVYGLGSFGRNYGVVYTPGGIVAAFGPLIGALVLDHLGSFVLAFVFSGLLVVVALGLSL